MSVLGAMRAPEWWRKCKAALGGWFWLPCPLCGQMFGGFEAGDRSVPGLHWDSEGRLVNVNWICCRRCSK